MDTKVLLEARVPSHKALAILTGFPTHEGDRMRKLQNMGSHVKFTWFINSWTYHQDQVDFLHRNRVLCTVYPVSGPRVSLDRYAAYATKS